ncbi:hypothetical protein OBBRIDRAFT_892171 [Obba rivulosa]|uniref:Uncharacterized protein n=1 Tax=Obba rivulosa TaxID=1052685 RepID=A0A8E2DDE0_9APHY|nr:hypothetical protein OBBRIDRAFT_892171 [Obba rivulosa]
MPRKKRTHEEVVAERDAKERNKTAQTARKVKGLKAITDVQEKNRQKDAKGPSRGKFECSTLDELKVKMDAAEAASSPPQMEVDNISEPADEGQQQGQEESIDPPSSPTASHAGEVVEPPTPYYRIDSPRIEEFPIYDSDEWSLTEADEAYVRHRLGLEPYPDPLSFNRYSEELAEKVVEKYRKQYLTGNHAKPGDVRVEDEDDGHRSKKMKLSDTDKENVPQSATCKADDRSKGPTCERKVFQVNGPAYRRR